MQSRNPETLQNKLRFIGPRHLGAETGFVSDTAALRQNARVGRLLPNDYASLPPQDRTTLLLYDTFHVNEGWKHL